ncbi:MAG: DNA adenine methylase, partial [Thermomicrobiales bacterium]
KGEGERYREGRMLLNAATLLAHPLPSPLLVSNGEGPGVRFAAAMIKYIGSKRTLVPAIVGIVRSLPDVRRVCDLFAGTTRIGQALKRCGLWVHSNDLATYSEVFGTTYIATNAETADIRRMQRLLTELSALPPERGYFTETFCEQSRYFQPFNGMKMDAIRAVIDVLAADETERAILLTSLIEAADRVDSTTGLQMAYLKGWSARSYNPLALRLPDLLPGNGAVTRMDANDLARQLDDDIDLVYIDPPYNQHSYFSNYHIWETFVRNDAPPTYGIAKKREDCRTEKSAYNAKKQAGTVFADLVNAIRAPYLLVSFNSEGYFTRDEISAMLNNKGYVASVALDFKRYVGAQIGIFNPSGEKVGKVSHLRNHEHLFLVGPDRAHVEAAISATQERAQTKQIALFGD